MTAIKGNLHKLINDSCKVGALGSAGNLSQINELWEPGTSLALEPATGADPDPLESDVLSIPANSQLMSIVVLQNSREMDAAANIPNWVVQGRIKDSGSGVDVGDWKDVGTLTFRGASVAASSEELGVPRSAIPAGTEAAPKWFFASDEFDRDFRLMPAAAVTTDATKALKVRMILVFGNL